MLIIILLLQVELSRVGGKFPQDRICEAASECSGDSNESVDEDQNGTSTVVCRVGFRAEKFGDAL